MVYCLDVTDYGALPGIVEQTQRLVRGGGLNLLINNAGILGKQALDEITPEKMRECFEVNSIAPLMIAKVSLYINVNKNKNNNGVLKYLYVQQQLLLVKL